MNYRDQTVCMMRVKNEARWIRRSLERTFEVCKFVVIWDDKSTDNTEDEAIGVIKEARHPLQYLPYQYEGYSPAQRQALRSTDIRMRIIAPGK